MSERKDEKWLDEQLQRAVDGATPVFDAQAWKQKYAREFQTLLGRSGQPGQSGTGRTVRLVLRGSIGKLAIAAAVLATVGVLLLGRFAPHRCSRRARFGSAIAGPDGQHDFAFGRISAGRDGGVGQAM